MPVSSSTEHWIKPDALSINLNHFGDPDYLQVSVLAGAVVMAFKQDVIGYNAAHNYRTWPLDAANTYLETTSAYNVYVRLTRSEVNARALVIYDTVLRDIEGREISYAEDGSEVLGEANSEYFFVFLGQISTSVNSNGESVQREWTIDFRMGNLDTNQYRNEESTGEWTKMFRLNKVTDFIEVLKTISSATFKRWSIKKGDTEKNVTDIKRSDDSDEDVPINDETIPTTKYAQSMNDDRYLSKIKPDETPYHIGLKGGLTTTEVTSTDYAKDVPKAGWAAKKNDKEEWYMEADHLIARILARVYDLLVENHAIFKGDLSSEEFISGFIGGKGWAIRMKEWENAAGEKEIRSYAEFDDLIVRGSLRIYEFIVSQMLGENDNRIFTGMMEVDHYDAADGKVYLKTDGGKLYNPFRVDDVIIVQQYGGMPTEDSGYYVTKQYEFIVTGVGIGNTEDGEDRLDWLTFRNFTTAMEGGDLSLIAERDTLVRIDNLSDARRKGIIQMMSVGEDTPYMDFIYGAKTDPDNALKGRFGNIGGIYNPLFGWLKEFGAYLTNLYAVGEFRIAHTGEDVADAIEIAKGLFRTNYKQTTFDMTEEDNFFTNAAMTNNCEHWVMGEESTSYFLVDDLPQFFNYELYGSEDSFAGIAEHNGRDMLRLSQNTILQSNSLIKKPGTHKVHTGTTENADGTYTKVFEEVPDTLYLSVRVYCVSSGLVELGFTDANGAFYNNDFHVSRELTAQEDAYTIKVSSTWDGLGDFCIKSSGDVFIDLLSLTDKPLENFMITTSTSIEQTAEAISMLGYKMNGPEGTVTNLKLQVNAMAGTISSTVGEVNKINNTIITSGWINTADSVRIFSEQVKAQGIAKTAEIKVYVDDSISKIRISADQIDMTANDFINIINQGTTTINASRINLNGVVTANNTFKIDTSGYMTCTGGTIGGFSIKQDYITGGNNIKMSLNVNDDGYPSIKWGVSSKTYVSLGMNVGSFMNGQLGLYNNNTTRNESAILNPAFLTLNGVYHNIQLSAGLTDVTTGNILPAIKIYRQTYPTRIVSLGVGSTGKISIVATNWPTSSSEVSVGEVYLDGTTLRVKTS